MATVLNYVEGKAFVNFFGKDGGGFSENYKLPWVDYATANTQLAAILTPRAALLAYNWEIVHATVSQKTEIGDSSLPTLTATAGMLLDAEADLALDALCNDREVGFLIRFDTNVGKTARRLIRALRDSWVTNAVSTLTWTDLPAPFVPVVTVAADPSATAIDNFLKAVGYYTKFYDKVPATVPQQYDPLDWALIQYQRVAYRDMGKGFSQRKARRKAKI